jgi:hypothetical protein
MDGANAKKYILATIQACGRKDYVAEISQGLRVYCVGKLTNEPEPRRYEVNIDRSDFPNGRTTHKCVINWTRGEFPSIVSMLIKEGDQWVPVSLDAGPNGPASAASSSHDSHSTHGGTAPSPTQITADTGYSGSMPPTVPRSLQTSNSTERNSMNDTGDGHILKAVTIPVSANTTDQN